MSKTKSETKKAHQVPRRAKKKHESKTKKSSEPWIPPPCYVDVPDIRNGLNAGRWTLEENLLFLQAVKIYGTKGSGIFRKINLFVPTR